MSKSESSARQKSPEQLSQAARFRAAAREAGCDESVERFEAALGALARTPHKPHKPVEKPTRKRRKAR